MKNIVTKLSQFCGRVIGAMFSERALALAIFAGRPVWALVWATARAIK